MKFYIWLCFYFYYTILTILVVSSYEQQKRESAPQRPVSVLEELLNEVNNSNNGNSGGSSGLIPGSDKDSGSARNIVSGIPFLDFFRNIIGVLISIFQQLYNILYLLSRTLFDNQNNVLRDERSTQINGDSVKEGIPVVEQLEHSISLFQRSVQEFSQNLYLFLNRELKNGSEVPLLGQYEDLLHLWTNQAKRKTDPFRQMLIESTLENKKRDKRDLWLQFNKQLETMQSPIKSLLNEFYRSLNNETNGFHK